MTMHTDKPTDSEFIVFITNKYHNKLLALEPDSIFGSKLVACAKTLATMNAANLPEKIDKNEEVNERGDDETNANNADQHTKTQKHKKEEGLTRCQLYSDAIAGIEQEKK